MKEHIRLDGLLVSQDPQVLLVMSQVLSNFAIKSQVCVEFSQAIAAVAQKRFDAVIVDWNGGPDPIRVINGVRKSTPNGNTTLVAMVEESCEMRAALLAGANFVIHRATSLDGTKRCMREAYGTMLNQRRRSARCAVDIQVIATVPKLGRLEATVTDLSVGGMALQCDRLLDLHATITLQFLLPGSNDLIHVSGKVVNQDGIGRAGICFASVPEADSTLLVTWLATELAEQEDAEPPAGDFLKRINRPTTEHAIGQGSWTTI